MIGLLAYPSLIWPDLRIIPWFFFGYMNKGVILHECHSWLPHTRDEIWVSSLFGLVSGRVSLHYHHIRTLISINGPLHHDADVLAFLIWTNHLFIILLVWRTEDLNTLAPNASFKRTFLSGDSTLRPERANHFYDVSLLAMEIKSLTKRGAAS